MAWNKNSGGRGSQGGNQGPWGNPSPGSGGGRKSDQPPDLEEIVRQGRERLRKLLPQGAAGGSMLGLLVIVLGGLWLASGVYQVGQAELGVVQRFGKFVGLTQPGLRWRLPWPIETAQVIKFSSTNNEIIGVESDDQARVAPAGVDESLMLTGDRNFLKVKFLVRWRVNDAKKFAFDVKDPVATIRSTAQSAMREVVGRGSFDQLQTGQRTATEEEVKRLLQAALDSYQAGVEVLLINLQSVDPPDKALEAARDVQTAGQEKETMRNSAEAYQNKIIPEARGKAEQIIQGAQGYKQKVIADAQGETQRFLSVYEQYKKAPDVTRRRMYLETMETVLGGINKVIMDRSAAGGVIPYLPLGELGRTLPPASNPPAGPAGGNN